MAKYTKLLYSIAVFVITFVVYALTAAPGVTFTDSGELAAVCTTLGVAHQTGYPLFVLLGHLWTLLPLPFSAIYSLNLMAAFFTAMSALVFMHLCFLLLDFVSSHKYMKSVIQDAKKRKHVSYSMRKIKPLIESNYITLLAFIVALVYGFSQTVWAQANYIEVYSLHLLLLNTILYTFIKGIFSDEKPEKYFFLSAFLLGLSLTNHGSTIYILPGILFFFFKRPGELFTFSKERFKLLLWLFIPFFTGLSLYLYLPIVSATSPEFDMGGVSRSIGKLFYHIRGGQYSVFMFEGENLWKHVARFFTLIPYQLAWIGIIPAIVGLHRLFTASRSLFLFLLINILVSGFMAVNYGIHDIDSYFLTAYIALILITAVGIYELLENTNNKDRVRFIVPAHLLLPLALIFMNLKENDRSDDYLVSEYTKILVDNVEKNGIIISQKWDWFASAFWYMQRVEGYRPDIVLIEKEFLRRTWYPDMLRKWYPDVINKSSNEINNFLKFLEDFESGKPYDTYSIQNSYIVMLHSFIEKNIDSLPVYVTSDILNPRVNSDNFFGDYIPVPQGLAFRLLKTSKYIPPDFKKLNFEKFISSIKERNDHLEEGVRVDVSEILTEMARYCYKNFNIDDAKKLYETAVRVFPKNQEAIREKNNIKNTN